MMESGRVTREWLEGLDPAEFQEISAMISDIQRERAMARQLKLEQRRSATRKKLRVPPALSQACRHCRHLETSTVVSKT